MFIFCLNTNAVATNDDTCKVKIETVSSQPAIVHEFFSCLEKRKFFSLGIFCNSHVDFSFVTKDNEYTETNTEYKCLDNLETLINKVDYNKFKITTGNTKKGEQLIVASLYLYEDIDEFVVNIMLVLNQNSSITKIIVF